MVPAQERMADDQMVRHLHGVMLIDEVVRKVADLTAHRREAILIVARLVNATVEAIEVRADLRTWITDADLQKAETLIADRNDVMSKVVHQEVEPSPEKVEDLSHAATKVGGALDLRCVAVDHRSRIVAQAQAARRGLSVESHLVADLRSVRADQVVRKWGRRGLSVESHLVADHRLVRAGQVVRKWGRRGLSVESHLVADHRSVRVDQVVRKWGHRGLSVESHLAADHRLVRVEQAVLRWDHHG